MPAEPPTTPTPPFPTDPRGLPGHKVISAGALIDPVVVTAGTKIVLVSVALHPETVTSTVTVD